MPSCWGSEARSSLQVIQNGGEWRLAADDMPCSCMERRYFLRISLMDLSGSCDIILNNDQAKLQLRCATLKQSKAVRLCEKYLQPCCLARLSTVDRMWCRPGAWMQACLTVKFALANLKPPQLLVPSNHFRGRAS